MIFHCTGGKHRTGICAPPLLKAFGVPEAYILLDHDLLNVYKAESLRPIYTKLAAMGIGREKATPYQQWQNGL